MQEFFNILIHAQWDIVFFLKVYGYQCFVDQGPLLLTWFNFNPNMDK